MSTNKLATTSKRVNPSVVYSFISLLGGDAQNREKGLNFVALDIFSALITPSGAVLIRNGTVHLCKI